MALAILTEDPQTPADFMAWGFANMAHHRDIIRVLSEQSGEYLAEYVIDPFNPLSHDDFQAWRYLHQSMHDDMNRVLGIEGYNLSELDWLDEEERIVWLSAHANEHYRAGQILNLD